MVSLSASAPARGADRWAAISYMDTIHMCLVDIEGWVSPVHWNGALAKVAPNASAVGMLVLRTSPFVILLL